MRQTAVIQSTVSSNRIEGIEAPDARVRDIVYQRTLPLGRSEQEIAGYRDALSSIHTKHQYMPLSTGVVLQLHRDLYQFTASPGGRWKDSENVIAERLPDGSTAVRFTTVPAYQTPEFMTHLGDYGV